jgi:hypothetical protein
MEQAEKVRKRAPKGESTWTLDGSRKANNYPRVTVNSSGVLDPRSERIAILWFEGMPKGQIAQEVGVCGTWVKRILEHPAVAARVAFLMESRELAVMDRLTRLAPKAMKLFEKQYDQADSGQLNFSQERHLINDTLDRTGYPRQSATNIHHEHRTTLDVAGIEQLAEFGRQLLSSGALAGVDYRAMGQRLQAEGAVVDVPLAEGVVSCTE